MDLPDQFETMRDDVAFLRAMVLDAGRSGIGDGFGLIAAGACYGVAGTASFVVKSSPDMYGITVAAIFGWASFVLFALQLVRWWRNRGTRGPATPIGRFADATRWGLGLAILTVAVAFSLANGLHGALLQPFISVVVFAIYGAIWVAIAAATSMRWPWAVAALSYATALILARLADSNWQFLAFGIAMFALGLLPGLRIKMQGQP